MASSTDAAQAATHAAENGASGLPQLDFTTWPSQIFWLVVAMVVLFQLLNKVALPRVASVLEERADAIADDLDRAEEFKRKASEAEEAYHRALADARAKAQAIANEKRDEIQKEVEAEMAQADAEIAARAEESEVRIREIRESAMESVEEVATETAHALVDRLLPEAAERKALETAVQSEIR